MAVSKFERKKKTFHILSDLYFIFFFWKKCLVFTEPVVIVIEISGGENIAILNFSHIEQTEDQVSRRCLKSKTCFFVFFFHACTCTTFSGFSTLRRWPPLLSLNIFPDYRSRSV